MSAHPYVSDWRESRLQGMTTTLRKIRAAPRARAKSR